MMLSVLQLLILSVAITTCSRRHFVTERENFYHGTVQTSEMWCAVYMCLSQGPLLSVHSASLSRTVRLAVSVVVYDRI